MVGFLEAIVLTRPFFGASLALCYLSVLPLIPALVSVRYRNVEQMCLSCAVSGCTYRCSYIHRLCATDLPLHVRDADFLSSLLIIVIPLAIWQLNARELGARLRPCRKELPLSLELCKLEASAVELEDVDLLRRVALWVRGGCFDNVRGVLTL
jgi:hypothetical protein